jgi:biotin transport system substrate-specific component
MAKSKATSDFTRLVSMALFAALFAFSSYISLPLGNIPFTAQSFFVLLAGLLLGSTVASLSVMLWLLLGFFGLPVFARGTGGMAIFLSPTGGYLIGYILMAYTAGLAKKMPIPKSDGKIIIRSIFRTIHLLPAMLAVYVVGLPWMRWRLGLQPIDANNPALGSAYISWARALTMGFWPFLLTDLLKTFLAAFTYEAIFRRRRK